MKLNKKILLTTAFVVSSFFMAQAASAFSNDTSATSYANAGPGGATSYANYENNTNWGGGGLGFGGYSIPYGITSILRPSRPANVTVYRPFNNDCYDDYDFCDNECQDPCNNTSGFGGYSIYCR